MGRAAQHELSDEQKDIRCSVNLGNPLNAEIYDPSANQRVPASGAWAMIRRPLPAIEHNIDRRVTVGRVFWVEQCDEADEDGFLRDGTYKVICHSPFGDVCLWPYEYVTLAAEYLTRAWQEGYFVFHAIGLSDKQFSDQLFYCMSRGISRADATVMSLGTISGPVGWFEPSEELVEYVSAFRNVSSGLGVKRDGEFPKVNRERRSQSRKRASGGGS